MFTNRAARGIAECEQALVLNPNLADAHAARGLAKFLVGRAAETEGHVLEALRLSPRDTFGQLCEFAEKLNEGSPSPGI